MWLLVTKLIKRVITLQSTHISSGNYTSTETTTTPDRHVWKYLILIMKPYILIFPCYPDKRLDIPFNNNLIMPKSFFFADFYKIFKNLLKETYGCGENINSKGAIWFGASQEIWLPDISTITPSIRICGLVQ